MRLIPPSHKKALSLQEGASFDPIEHKYYDGEGKEVPATTWLLKEMGIVNTKWYTEYSSRKGQAIHAAVELELRKEIDKYEVDAVCLPYLRDFREWLDDSGFKAMHMEQPMVSGFGYGVTPDIIGALNNSVVVVEVKSGQVPPWADLQTAAQLVAANEVLNTVIVERYTLQLKGGSGYSFKPLPVKDNRRDKDDFLALCRAYHVKRRYTK